MKIKTKKIMMVALAVLLTLSTIGCNVDTADDSPEVGSTMENVSDKRTITDMVGRTVEIPEEINTAMGLGCTNRFFVYLDSADKMAGLTTESRREDPINQPYAMAIRSKLPDMPIYDQNDLETISALDPDVLFLCLGESHRDFQDEENISTRTNIPLVITKPYVTLSRNTKEFYETVEIFGDLLGKESRAKELIKGVKEIINDLNERTKDIPDEDKPTVHVGGKAWSGSHGIASTSSYYSAFDFINAKNIVADLEQENVFIDPEALLSWDPDFIFVESGTYDGFRLTMEDLNKPQFQSLKALQNNEVHRIFLKIWCNTNFANVLVNSYYIGSVIYPEQFSDVDFEKKADEIYELFLGRPIYEEAVEVYGKHEKLEREYIETYK